MLPPSSFFYRAATKRGFSNLFGLLKGMRVLNLGGEERSVVKVRVVFAIEYIVPLLPLLPHYHHHHHHHRGRALLQTVKTTTTTNRNNNITPSFITTPTTTVTPCCVHLI